MYDVTPFMDDHPGGDEVLLSATGNAVIFINTKCFCEVNVTNKRLI